jgi:uncharacterized protein YoaH (UPF0181 family)
MNRPMTEDEQQVKEKIQRLMDSGFTYEQAMGVVSYVESEKSAERKIVQQKEENK